METLNLCLLVVLLAATGTVVGEDIYKCSDLNGHCGNADDCSIYISTPDCPDQVCCPNTVPRNELVPEQAGRSSCSKTLRMCKNLGGECMDSAENAECDTIEMNKCRSNCSCCINCADQRIPKPCKNRYNGTCNATCSEDFLEVRDCRAGCKCCGCEKLEECKAEGGFCVTNKSECEDRLESEWCNGKRCHCCIRNCSSDILCDIAGGRCLGTCSSPDRSFPLLCPGQENCTCCAPEPNNFVACLFMGGLCLPGIFQCPGTAFGTCGFFNFQCCLPA